MIKNLKSDNLSKYFGFFLILILVFSRLIPHPPNFTPIIATAILGSYFFRNLIKSTFIILISMFISDFFIGFHSNMFFVYFAMLLIIIVYFSVNIKLNYKNLLIYGFIASFIFYLTSNFGVWLIGNMYEKSFSGLIQCYILAIPFFKNTLISTFIYLYPVFFFYNSLNRYFFSKLNN